MKLWNALRSIWRFCHGRCPVHNEPLGRCAGCVAEFGRGSMWD
jgi:hypothetical protein